MRPEARAAESKKRAARRQVAKQKEKDRKVTAEKVRQAEMLQAVHVRATAEALAKQAAVHAVAMLKSEVVTQFAGDQFGSTASSVSAARGVATPSVTGPVIDARATFPVGGPVAPRCSGGVHDGRWRVPALHRPQPHACCGRRIVRAQQGSTTPRRR
jgi:hypothetical protein